MERRVASPKAEVSCATASAKAPASVSSVMAPSVYWPSRPFPYPRRRNRIATRDDVVEVLGSVDEPLLGRALTELEMVRAVEVAGSHVRVTIALPVSNHPLVGEIDDAVADAVGRVEGVTEVDVGFVVMTEDDAAALREKLQGIHGGTAKSPLMDPNTRTRIIAVASGKGGVG